MALIANAQIIAPPKELLGNFTIPGLPDKIISWTEDLDLKSFDAAIISQDMLAYGGAVASRINRISASNALARIDFLRKIKKLYPKLPIYVQNSIMRIAPTGDGKNEAYKMELAQWGEISVLKDEKSKIKTRELESKIPKDVLNDYKKTRERNLEINLQSVKLVKEGVIDYLVLSQDDAKPQGIQIADRNRLITEVKKNGLEDKISIQPGADEVSMLLLAHSLNIKFNYLPKIKVVYSSEAISKTVMPYEDIPLYETVAHHIKVLGGHEVDNEESADILFYVFVSRFEPGKAKYFAEEIENKIKQGRKVIVADIDSRGNVQGGDIKFTKELENRRLFPELSGYASWNTAANTIGTALPQGVIFSWAKTEFIDMPSVADKIWTAQNWFTFLRVLDDFYYHTLVRSRIKDIVSQNKSGDGIVSPKMTESVKDLSTRLLAKYFKHLSKIYFLMPEFDNQKNVECKKPSNLRFDFPWGRTFEAEIDFDLECHEAKK